MHDSDLIAGFYDYEDDVRRARDWGGDDLFTAGPPRRRRFERASRMRDEPHAPPPAPPHPERTPEPAPVGRRTVTITGRPDPQPVQRRPARTMDERVAHRPERIASWTCALGALSVLLAIVTSQ